AHRTRRSTLDRGARPRARSAPARGEQLERVAGGVERVVPSDGAGGRAELFSEEREEDGVSARPTGEERRERPPEQRLFPVAERARNAQARRVLRLDLDHGALDATALERDPRQRRGHLRCEARPRTRAANPVADLEPTRRARM